MRCSGGQIEEARAAFFAEAKSSHQEAWILGQAAELFFLSTDMPAALAAELADAALARSPNLPEPILVKAVMLVSRGERDKALRALEHYLRLGHQLRRGFKRFATAALEAGDYELAKETLARLLALPEERRELMESVVGVLRDFLNNSSFSRTETDNDVLREMAMEYIDQLLKTAPQEAWFLTLQSDIFESTGAVEEAVEVYRNAMVRNPVDSSVYNNLAYLFARRGEQLDEALQLVRRAKALEPRHNVYYLDTEGWVAFQQGRYADAERLIRGSLSQMSEDQGSAVAESFWHLGKVYVRQGRVSEATQAFFRALRLDPNGSYGRRARTDLEAIGVLPPRPEHVGGLHP